MNTTFRIEMVHVPYKGAAPALIDMVGGHMPIGLVAPTVALPHVKSGRLRALGVTSAKRSGSMPDIPTIAEQGAPGFDIVQWYAVWLPAKTPKDIVDKLHGEIVRIIQSPEYRQRQQEVATDIVGTSPEALGDFQKSEIEKYRKIGVAAGIKPE
jgi:tripartite-type tricarboxylate transporter receptor subunit TctC